jgi:hypothetical protein
MNITAMTPAQMVHAGKSRDGSVGVKGDQMNRYLGRVAQSRSTVGSASSPSSRIPCLTKARPRRLSAAASNLVIGLTRTLDELEWSPRGRSFVATDRQYPPARKPSPCWRLTDSDWGGAGPSQSDPEETFSRHRGQRPIGHISLVPVHPIGHISLVPVHKGVFSAM